jgi:pimeloyl-ACP methyl ester carboxylesterase
MEDFDLDREGGRIVRVRTVGAMDGPLVVYLHGVPASRLDIDALAKTSAAMGVRLAAFDRPGFGGSNPSDFDFASVAADACAIADLLDAPHFSAVGQSAGCGYVLAIAALHPDRVTSVATTGGSLPYEPSNAWWEQLSEGEKVGIGLIGIDDEQARRLLAERDVEFMDVLELDDDGLAAFWRRTVSPADLRTLDAGFGWLLVATMRESLRQGQGGWARDNVVRMGPWHFAMDQIRCPVSVWYGDEDSYPEQRVAWLRERIPHAEARILLDRGHMVAFDEWHQVLESLGL